MEQFSWSRQKVCIFIITIALMINDYLFELVCVPAIGKQNLQSERPRDWSLIILAWTAVLIQ